MSVDSFQFEGEQVTARQLRKQFTAYSQGAIQSALESGCKDAKSLNLYLSRRDQWRIASQTSGGRIGASRSGWSRMGA